MCVGRILPPLCLVWFALSSEEGSGKDLEVDVHSEAGFSAADSAGVKISDVVFKSTLDGTDQRYVLMLPPSFDPTMEHDVIIALHGHGADRWQFVKDERSEATAFRTFAAKYSMIAISPDYRAKTSWMGASAEADLVQVIEEVTQKYRTRKVFLIGGSMGGTSALTFAALHPDMIDGVTSMNGHANHLEYDNFQKAISESFGGQKNVIPEEYKKRSAEYWPERLTMPIAFTVGEHDKSVPPQSVMRLATVLKALKRKVMIIVHPEGGHSTRFHEAMAAMEFMIKP